MSRPSIQYIMLSTALLLIAAGLSGCMRPNRSSNSFLSFAKESSADLIAEKVVNGIKYELRYIPWQAQVIHSEKVNASDESAINQKKKEYLPLQYFMLRITALEHTGELLKYNLESEQEYSSRVHYCYSLIHEDIQLLDGKEERACSFSHMERIYNAAPFVSFSLAFERSAKEQKKLQNEDDISFADKTVVFNDVMFGNGPIRLSIDGESIAEASRQF
jgi:hypothetical protein